MTTSNFYIILILSFLVIQQSSLICNAFSNTQYKTPIPTKSLMPHIDTNTESLMPSSTALGLQLDAENIVAHALGYTVGAGSLFVYTPIAFRVLRQKTADGLSLSTWWLKMSAFTCSDLYALHMQYPLSTYIDWLTLTAEVTANLFLVAYYQNRMDDKFFAMVGLFVLSIFTLSHGPSDLLSFGQVGSTVLNVGALLPQFVLNAKLRTAGDYSPVTATLGSAGSAIRLYTTLQLADGDQLLMISFFITLLLNLALLTQILWYGVAVEGRDIISVMTSDLGPRNTQKERTVATQRVG